MSSFKRPLLAATVALLLSGCMVGPNYHGAPEVTPAAKGFRRADATAVNAEPVAQWWTALGDPELSHLIDETLATNPGIDVARARVREARASLRQQTATGLPSVGADAAYLRTANVESLLGANSSGGSSDQGSGASGSSGSGSSGGGLNLYVVGFDATWELDFFGGNRRAVEGASAAVDASEATVADAIVTLTAEVAQSYVQLCGARQRLALTQQNIDIESRLAELMKVRRANGVATELDIVRVDNQLDTTRALVPTLNATISEQLNRLAALMAKAPGDLDAELANVAVVPAPRRQPRSVIPLPCCAADRTFVSRSAGSHSRPRRSDRMWRRNSPRSVCWGPSVLPPRTPEICSTAVISPISQARYCNGRPGISAACGRGPRRPDPRATKPKRTTARRCSTRSPTLRRRWLSTASSATRSRFWDGPGPRPRKPTG